MQGILTSLTGPDGAVYDNVTNTTAPPAFNLSYFNGTAGVVIVEDRQTPIAGAAALDEGGNFIDLQFGPLFLAGDYSGPAGVGATGNIGVLDTGGGSNGGSGGGGWACLISVASAEGSFSRDALSFAAIVLIIAALVAAAGCLRKFKRLASADAKVFIVLLAAGLIPGLVGSPAGATVRIQCPGDLNSDAVPDPFILDVNGNPTATPNPAYDPDVVCKHITAGDGFINMRSSTAPGTASPPGRRRWRASRG